MIYDGEIVDLSEIKKNYEEYNKKYFDLNKLKINYWNSLYKHYNNNCSSLSFWNLRYFQLNFSKQLKELSIPYVYLCYYKENIIPRDSELYQYRMKESYKNEQLYIYFFYQIIYQIFKIIDNTYVCLNKGLINPNCQTEMKPSDVAKKLKQDIFGNKKHIIDFYNKSTSTAYRASKLCKIKESYRNIYTHDFATDIPRAIYDNMKIDYEYFDIESSFKDLMSLFKILDKHLKQVEIIVKMYINNKKLK